MSEQARSSWSVRSQASFSGSVIDTVIQTVILNTVPVDCHGDNTSLAFHNTPLFSLLILLVHDSKFNVHDTPTGIGFSDCSLAGGMIFSVLYPPRWKKSSHLLATSPPLEKALALLSTDGGTGRQQTQLRVADACSSIAPCWFSSYPTQSAS